MEAGITDLRGKMHRAKRQMPSEDVKEYLRSRKVAHVATKDAQGWPYITPLVYIYEDAICSTSIRVTIRDISLPICNMTRVYAWKWPTLDRCIRESLMRAIRRWFIQAW